MIKSGASSYSAARLAASASTYSNMTGHLATIDSVGEYRFLSWILRARDAYVSGSDSVAEGQWLFTDGHAIGQPVAYLPWTFGEPNGEDDENCLALSPTDGVRDIDCNTSKMDYVVEFDRK